MLKKKSLPEVLKRAISDFVGDKLIMENIDERRRMNYYQRIRVTTRWTSDTFLNTSKDDVRTILVRLNDGYTEWTKATY